MAKRIHSSPRFSQSNPCILSPLSFFVVNPIHSPSLVVRSQIHTPHPTLPYPTPPHPYPTPPYPTLPYPTLPHLLCVFRSKTSVQSLQSLTRNVFLSNHHPFLPLIFWNQHTAILVSQTLEHEMNGDEHRWDVTCHRLPGRGEGLAGKSKEENVS